MKRTLIVLVCAALLLGPRSAGAQTRPWPGVPILMYHKVDAQTPGDAVGRSLTLEPSVFAAQLTWLQAHAIRTLTTKELAAAMARGEQPHDAVVLTFDDGYEDAYLDVLPLLQKFGAKASFYVSADLIGSPHHLSWKELRAMRDAGMEIGCHGSRHLDLKTISRSEKEYEIGHCAAAVRHWLGNAPKTYAYAAGQYDGAALAIVRENGFIAGLTEHSGVVTTFDRPLELPRRRVDRGDSLGAFETIARP